MRPGEIIPLSYSMGSQEAGSLLCERLVSGLGVRTEVRVSGLDVRALSDDEEGEQGSPGNSALFRPLVVSVSSTASLDELFTSFIMSAIINFVG